MGCIKSILIFLKCKNRREYIHVSGRLNTIMAANCKAFARHLRV